MDTKHFITTNLQQMRENSSQFDIFFVVNVAGKTEIFDYQDTTQSILTEYLTEDEYDTMITALKKSGFRIKVFNNELSFIDYIRRHDKELDFKHIIVFNLARNGKGLNKKALIPSFCQFYGIMMTGSDAYHVCLGRHKFHVNCILSSKGIPVPKTWCYTPNGWLLDDAPDKDRKVIIKPAFESASRGINLNSITYPTDALETQVLQLQREFEQDILVQEFISGYEVQVPVMKLDGQFRAFMAVGIDMDHDPMLDEKVITYDIAYDETYSFYDFSTVDHSLALQLMKTAEKACALLGLDHYGRFDFRIDRNGHYYITDISTHPFLIKHSAFAYLFSALDFEYEDIFLLLIRLILNEKEAGNENQDRKNQ